MELLPTSEEPPVRGDSFWRNPRAWFLDKNLGRGYWVFFSAAFFYDAGFSIYFFLFNLYLFDRGFNERTMGWIGGAMTAGSLVGTLPVGALARRIALRPLLAMIFVASAATNALRTVWVWEPAQIGLAFLTGLAMCGWGVCYLPAVARLTNERNRTSGFSLIFSVSIGTAMLGGIVCGYLRQWLGMAGIAMQAAEVKRLILLVSCGIVLLGLIPVFRLRVPSPPGEEATSKIDQKRGKWLRAWKLRPFLLRFLPSMALWSAVLAAFTPFGNIYLTRDLHISMAKIGLIFSAVQLVQFCMGLATPVVFRALGLANGIAVIQIAAAVVLGSLAGVTNVKLAVALYLTFAAAQWMSLPGLYNLLMNETPDGDRSTASALMMFFNALAGSVATAAAGVLFTRFGYPRVLLGLAIVALAVALLLRFLIAPRDASPHDDHDSGCSTLVAPSSCQVEV
jgi:predicted MFS family arabinose efflux permease